MDIKIRRALFSVSDKSHLETFARGLFKINPSMQILASGGTAKALTSANLPITPLTEENGFPEYFGGRIKTLHPKLLGGILYRRDIDEAQAEKASIEPIDLIVCNLYPFEEASRNPNTKMPELIESMDIGGSSLIRSACKNYLSVAVVIDADDYSDILEELNVHQGSLTLKTRENLAVKAMQFSAHYEAKIAEEFALRLQGEKKLTLHLKNGRKLRYGENPDQEGWVYSLENTEGIASAKILGGKELSYNNFEDASQAFLAAQKFFALASNPTVSIVKHGNLCGFATGPTLSDAFKRAWEGDSKSAFGSIVAITSEVDENFCNEIQNKFIEVILAPSFSPSFVQWVHLKKPSLRLLESSFTASMPWSYRSISGGMLAQTNKKGMQNALDRLFSPLKDKIGVATKRPPQEKHKGLSAFAIAALQGVKSNAIILVREWTPNYYQLIGVGSGQPNRIDSLQRLAIPKAIENLEREMKKEEVKRALGECILASDGFFPFADSILVAAEKGIQICIQPGGSTNDKEVIDAAEELDLCMIFTGERYFTH